EGQVAQVVLERTPFYAESGGQVSDRGHIYNDRCQAIVKEVAIAPVGQHVQTVEVKQGSLRVGDLVKAEVTRNEREDITKNHTATHLLHKALKEVLGDHVNQAGSLVAPERLRFDFSHFQAISDEELQQIEQMVNEKIWKDIPVQINTMKIDEAKKLGRSEEHTSELQSRF